VNLFGEIQAYISDNIGLLGALLSISCMYIEYRQSNDRYRLMLFVLLCISTITSVLIGDISDNQTKESRLKVEGLITGGKDSYPLVTFKLEDKTPVLYLTNPSKDFTLHDVECKYIPVSARNSVVIDYWAPQIAGRFAKIWPGESIRFDTLDAVRDVDETEEQRFNFFISCKNGQFNEQIVIRNKDGVVHCLVKIIKNGEVIYVTPNLSSYLYPDEKEFSFQPEMQGVDGDVKDPVLEKLVREKNFSYPSPSPYSKKDPNY
jgi:hypothetical protein